MTSGKCIVIVGGGVIGAAIAWFAARRGARPIIIERHEVANAASGKSGGFLALDWCRGSPLDGLARRSFRLHADLAEALGNPWGYRPLDTFAGSGRAGPQASGPRARPWLDPCVRLGEQLATKRTTAVLDPRAFTTALVQAAQAGGGTLRHGTATGLLRRPDGTVSGVELDDGEIVAGDAVVVAMGPWSILATQWLPLPAIYGFKGHSLIFRTGDAIGAEALFLEYEEESGEILTPELFSRADGRTWVCAVSSTASLPVDPADVAPDAGAHARLESMCRAISPVLAAAPIVARQACFRPVTEDGLPLIGAVPGARGAFVATGHSVWGMLNAPATGEAMVELILDGASRHVDLAPFAPGRLRPFDPARLRRR